VGDDEEEHAKPFGDCDFVETDKSKFDMKRDSGFRKIDFVESRH